MSKNQEMLSSDANMGETHQDALKRVLVSRSDDEIPVVDEQKSKVVCGHKMIADMATSTISPVTWDDLVREFWFGCYYTTNMSHPRNERRGRLPILLETPRGLRAFDRVIEAMQSVGPAPTGTKAEEDAFRLVIEAELTRWSREVPCELVILEDGVGRNGKPREVKRWKVKDVDVAILAYLWPKILNIVSAFLGSSRAVADTARVSQTDFAGYIAHYRGRYNPAEYCRRHPKVKHEPRLTDYIQECLKRNIHGIIGLSDTARRMDDLFRQVSSDLSNDMNSAAIAEMIARKMCSEESLKHLITHYETREKDKYPTVRECMVIFKINEPIAKNIVGKPLRDLFIKTKEKGLDVSPNELLQALVMRFDPLIKEILHKRNPGQMYDYVGAENDDPVGEFDFTSGTEQYLSAAHGAIGYGNNSKARSEDKKVVAESAFPLFTLSDGDEEYHIPQGIMACRQTLAYLWRYGKADECLILSLSLCPELTPTNIGSLIGIAQSKFQRASADAMALFRQFHNQPATTEAPGDLQQKVTAELWLFSCDKMPVFLLHTEKRFHTKHNGEPEKLAKWLKMPENNVRDWIKEMAEQKQRYEKMFGFLQSDVEDIND